MKYSQIRKRIKYAAIAVFLTVALSDLHLHAQSGEKPSVEKGEFLVSTKYMHIPSRWVYAKEGERLFIEQEGETIRWSMVNPEFSGQSPDWWQSINIEQFKGQPIKLSLESGKNEFLSKIEFSDVKRYPDPGPGGFYNESVRNQLSFSPKVGWNNDPNGLHYANGLYHMFFQYNPTSSAPSAAFNMHWGYAVSPDLIHWTEHDPAVYPFEKWKNPHSGSGFVDEVNSLSLNQGTNKTQVLAFSSGAQYLAYSTDKGKTWVQETTPVLPRKFPSDEDPKAKYYNRDPKIFYHEPTSKWVMVLHNGTKSLNTAFWIFTSDNLRDWTLTDEEPRFYECPEFMHLPLDGDTNNMKWVMYGAKFKANGAVSRSYYKVGSFNGEAFTPETDFIKGNFGPHVYAEQCFNNQPEGRTIMMGWKANGPSRAFSSQKFSPGMVIPLEIGLISTADGPRITFYPIRELEELRYNGTQKTNISFAGANRIIASKSGELDLDFRVTLGKGVFKLSIRGVEVKYNPASKELSVPSWKGKLATHSINIGDDSIEMRVLIDRASLDVFINGGRYASTVVPKYKPGDNAINFSGDGSLSSFSVYQMKSIWK